MRKLVLAVLFSVSVAIPARADVLDFAINGAAATWGWYELNKTTGGAKWFVGVSASIFTIRSVMGLFK